MISRRGLEISDVLCDIDKFRGPDQDFAGWLTKFELVVQVHELAPKRQVAWLQCLLGGPCQHVAIVFVKDYLETHPEPDGSDAADTRARDAHWSELCRALRQHLKQSPAVIGTAHDVRLLDRWRSLFQLDRESVQAYFGRVQYSLRMLNEHEPPIIIDEQDVLMTFVQGLAGPIRVHVESHSCKSMDEALELANAFEFAHRRDVGRHAPTTADDSFPAMSTQLHQHGLGRKWKQRRRAQAEPGSRDELCLNYCVMDDADTAKIATESMPGISINNVTSDLALAR